ncbi:hypothetical protein SDC9_160285 [bioreactor metagenome]|uniref:Uncharacterized protein n=1 Tax=bioreactor metagenome TaxID=1076179 RepID=A0A645FEZ2_9ZZZZ
MAKYISIIIAGLTGDVVKSVNAFDRVLLLFTRNPEETDFTIYSRVHPPTTE